MEGYLILREFKDTDFNEISDIMAKEWYEEVSQQKYLLTGYKDKGQKLTDLPQMTFATGNTTSTKT